MIIHEALLKELRKHVFIFHDTRYKSQHQNKFIERYIGKHKAATPEIIVINDQPQGFRRLTNKLEVLEEYPIQCELEYSLDPEYKDEKIIESFDLISEIKISLTNKIKALENIAKTYKDYVTIERSKIIYDQKDNRSTLLISSNLSLLIYERCFEDELYNKLISENNLKRLINLYFNQFNDCLMEISQAL